MMKTALISGITGQDGSYLAELLLKHNYKVVGLTRRTSLPNDARIKEIEKDIILHQGDITDSSSLFSFLLQYKNDNVIFFNLAAQSHVGTSFKCPQYTFNTVALAPLTILEMIRTSFPHYKFYQASSSEMFGDSVNGTVPNLYQDETTVFNPQSPYAIAKLAAYHTTKLYRNSYKIFTCNGILYNHESERRGHDFVTQKIIKYAKELKQNLNNYINESTSIYDYISSINIEKVTNHFLSTYPKLKLGKINIWRDWGHAEDYVEAMKLIMEHDKPDDYIVSTGQSYSIKQFLDIVFNYIDIPNYKSLIEFDESLLRPGEVPYLRGLSNKMYETFKWKPKHSIYDLVKRMMAK